MEISTAWEMEETRIILPLLSIDALAISSRLRVGICFSSSADTASARAGESITLAFTPNDGYMISNVTIDGEAQGAIDSYTFDNISSDHHVVVTFEPNGTEPMTPFEKSLSSNWISKILGFRE